MHFTSEYKIQSFESANQHFVSKVQKFVRTEKWAQSWACDWWLWGPVTTGAGHRDHYHCHTGHLWPLLMVTSYGHLGPPLTATYGHLLRSVFVVCAPTLSRKKDKSHFCNLIKWGVRTCKQVIPEDLNNLHPEWRMTYNDTFCIQIRFWKGIYLILNPPWSPSFPPSTRLSGGCGYDG